MNTLKKVTTLLLSLLILTSCSDDNNNAEMISSLTLSQLSLTPAFHPETTDYTATASFSKATVDFSVTTANSNISWIVNGETVTSNSHSVNLNVGVNTITIKIISRTGVEKTYTIVITREAPSDNADLASLDLSTGTLSPAFSELTTSYTVTVPYGTSATTVTAITDHADATLEIEGQPETTALPSSSIALAVGANTIDVSVTAVDGITIKNYSIVVTRLAASTDRSLSQLLVTPGVLSPTFSTNTTAYTVLTSDLASSITVTPTATDSLSTIEYSLNSAPFVAIASGDTSSSLTPITGANTLDVRVTAESGVQRTYTVTVNYNICPGGYYNDGSLACVPVGIGYYSPNNDNTRTACSNKPSNSRYTSPTATSASCPWSCDDGYLTTDGLTCNSYPNATILACNDNEVAVGIYGRSGSIIDRLGVRCAEIVDGNISTTVRNGPTYGGNGGSAFSEDCPAGASAYEVNGDLATYSGATRTGQIRYRCIDLVSLLPTSWSNGGSYWGSSSGLGSFNFQCGSGANPNGTSMNGIIVDNAGGAAYVGPLLGITCR